MTMKQSLRDCRLLLVLGALFLCGCTGSERFVSDWGEITVAPGVTGNCHSIPCRVFVEMPPGTGKYLVTANQVRYGEYPAGKTVSIGSIFESKAIKFPGTDFPPAYVYLSNRR